MPPEAPGKFQEKRGTCFVQGARGAEPGRSSGFQTICTRPKDAVKRDEGAVRCVVAARQAVDDFKGRPARPQAAAWRSCQRYQRCHQCYCSCARRAAHAATRCRLAGRGVSPWLASWQISQGSSEDAAELVDAAWLTAGAAGARAGAAAGAAAGARAGASTGIRGARAACSFTSSACRQRGQNAELWAVTEGGL